LKKEKERKKGKRGRKRKASRVSSNKGEEHFNFKNHF
jgi:hypothetical protein